MVDLNHRDSTTPGQKQNSLDYTANPSSGLTWGATSISGDRHALGSILRMDLSDMDISRLFGGIAGSQIVIKQAERDVDIWTSHGSFESPLYFTLERDLDGPTLTINDLFLNENAPKLLGTRIVANMLLQAAKIPGFNSIVASATRFYTPGDADTIREVNGYYFFPRLGFNADPEEADDYIEIPEEIKGKKLLSIMQDQDLRQWWKENGQTIDVSFNIRSQKSFKALFSYLAELGISAELQEM